MALVLPEDEVNSSVSGLLNLRRQQQRNRANGSGTLAASGNANGDVFSEANAEIGK
jgi:hypothetical protein